MTNNLGLPLFGCLRKGCEEDNFHLPFLKLISTKLVRFASCRKVIGHVISSIDDSLVRISGSLLRNACIWWIQW